MKNKFIKGLLLLSFFEFAAMTNVKADVVYETQSSNKSDYSVNFGTSGSDANIDVKGLNITADTSGAYFVKFVEQGATPATDLKTYTNEFNDYFGTSRSDYVTLSLKESGAVSGSVFAELYLLNKDTYAFVYNCTGKDADRLGDTYCKAVFDEPIKVGKTDKFPELSKRYDISFFAYDNEPNHVYIFNMFPDNFSSGIELTRNIHIGVINDKSLLSSLANGEVGSLSRLMEYAKTSPKLKTYNHNLKSGNTSFDDDSSFDIVNGAFYFIYTEVDNQGGKYIDLDDINVVMGKNGWFTTDLDWGEYKSDSTVTKDYEYACYLCNNEYLWYEKGYQPKACKIEENITTKAKCVKPVKTGVEDYLLEGFVILAIGSAVVYLMSKKSTFKKL